MPSFERLESGAQELVGVGCYVLVEYADHEKEIVRLVDIRAPGGVSEDFTEVSVDSPIGKAIVGHGSGEEVTYKTGAGGSVSLTILEVKSDPK